MAGIIDTNILLYAANRDAEQHPAASRFLHAAAASGEQWYLTEGIVYEFLRVATHPQVFPKPLDWKEALRFLRPILENPGFAILTAEEHHWRHLEDILASLNHPAGNLFFDIRTAALMREHGIRRIYTVDTDFLQFPDVKVVNPLRTASGA
jgi:toxin-antitoxin system PIN domain toxin